MGNTDVLSSTDLPSVDTLHSVQFSFPIVFNSLRTLGLQHARPPCPSPTPRVHSDSRPSSQWSHPAISSSVAPFSSCLQSFPESVFSNESALCIIHLVLRKQKLRWSLTCIPFQFSSVAQSCPTLRPHGLQSARLPCPCPTPAAYSNSCPLSWWRHPTISSSVVPFSSRLQSFPASGSFPMSQLFASGGQSIRVSALASILPVNIQDWSALGWAS